MERVTTGIKNLDEIMGGGLPLNSLNIVAGSPGTGKTILAQQFVFANATPDRPAIYLSTLSEPAAKLIRYLQQFTFFDENKVYNGSAAILYQDIAEDIKAMGLESLPDIVSNIIQEHQPAFLVIDSFKALRDLTTDAPRFRQIVFDLAGILSAYACTTLLVGEYSMADIDSMPEFAVVDGIIHLVNEKHGVQDERYVRVMKMRGSGYRAGEHAFRIDKSGLSVFPRLITPSVPEEYTSQAERISSGVPGLDAMLGGGLLRGSSTLVAGPAGSGKTILGLHFLFEGMARGEPCLLVSFQENPTKLALTVAGLGFDTDQLKKGGLLTHLYTSPVEMNIDDIVEQLIIAIESKAVRRVVIDALIDLENASWDKTRFRGYTYSMIQYLAVHNVTTYLTYETGVGSDYARLTDLHLSYLSDNVIALRYTGNGEISRNISVLKTRASSHERRISNFFITDRGLVIDGGKGRVSFK